MSLTCTLSLAPAGDAATIALLSRNLVEHSLPWSWTPDRIRRCRDDDDYIVLSARQGNEMVGFGVMQYLPNQSHLCLLGVVPNSRRQGIAAQMLKWLEKTAIVAGIFKVNLEVRGDNRGAVTFYRNQGYVTERKIRHYYSRGEHALRMTHDLRPASGKLTTD